MSHKTKQYKEGLSGQKPDLFDDLLGDKEARLAKEAGYRDYLRNRDLAEQLQEALRNERDHDSADYESPPARTTPFQRVFWGIVGMLQIGLPLLVAIDMGGGIAYLIIVVLLGFFGVFCLKYVTFSKQ